MKTKMKGFSKKISETDPKIVAIVSILAMFLVYFLIKADLTYSNAITMVSIFVLLGAFYKYGVSVLKNIAVVFLVIYISSIYTTITSSMHSYVIEPFFFTIGAATVFLATTYSEKNPQWNLSSRRLSVTFLMVILIPIKTAIILEGYSFIMAEVIGLNFLAIYIVIWRTFVSHNKKTKIVNPTEVYRKEVEKTLIVKVEENLEEDRKKYNAYLYREVFLANEKGYNTIFLSNSGSNRVFSLDYMRIGNKKVPFILQEDENEVYLESTLERLSEELLTIK